MPVAVKGTGGGSVTLTAGAAASDTTLTLPNTTGTVALTASPTFSGTVTATTVTSPASTALTIQSAGTTAVTVATNQNVGIGTTSPDYPLTVQSGDAAISFKDTGGTSRAYIGISGVFGSAPTGALRIRSDQGGLVYGYSGTEQMRIDSSGNLLVGTTGQINGAFGSRVNVQAGAANGIIVAGSAASWSPMVFVNASAAVIGNIGATQSIVSYNSASDYRLKKNVTPLAAGLANINALTPVTYDWINSDESGEGFIAHELQNVIPHAVTGEKDAVNEDGSIKPQGIDTSFLVATLTAAIQEQQAIITDQDVKMGQLVDQLTNAESTMNLLTEMFTESQQTVAALTARVEALEGTQP